MNLLAAILITTGKEVIIMQMIRTFFPYNMWSTSRKHTCCNWCKWPIYI